MCNNSSTITSTTATATFGLTVYVSHKANQRGYLSRVYLLAECPSCCRTDSVKGLTGMSYFHITYKHTVAYDSIYRVKFWDCDRSPSVLGVTGHLNGNPVSNLYASKNNESNILPLDIPFIERQND